MVTPKPIFPILDDTDPAYVGLLAAHPLLDGIGSTISDLGTNSYDATATGGFTWFNDPTLGVVLELDGTSAYIILNTAINTVINVQSTGTVAFWLKLRNATPVVATKTGLIDLQAFAGASSATKYPDTDGLGYFSTFRQIGRFNGVNLGATNRTTWHHLAITTISSGTYRVYIDGAQVGSTPAELGVHATIAATVGRSTDISGGPYYLDGYLGDFRIWQRELLAPEILTLFNNPWGLYGVDLVQEVEVPLVSAAVDIRESVDVAVTAFNTSIDLRETPDTPIVDSLLNAVDFPVDPDVGVNFLSAQVDVVVTPSTSFPPLADEIDPRRKPDTPVKFATQFDTSMVVAIPFAEGIGVTAGDFAGSAGGPHNATFTGTATWNTTSGGFIANDYNVAPALNPGSDYANVTRHLELEPPALITIAVWVTNTLGYQSTRAVIAKLGTAGFSYYLGTNSTSSGRRWRFQVQDNIDGVATLESTFDYPNSSWGLVHLVATYDGINLRIFIDGVQNNTLGNSGTIVYDITKDLRIGEGEGGTAFSGVIDDVRVWDGRVLDAAEVKDLYDSQFAMYCVEAMAPMVTACVDVRELPDVAVTALNTSIDLRETPDTPIVDALLTAIDLAIEPNVGVNYLSMQIEVVPPISNQAGLLVLGISPGVGNVDGGTAVTISGSKLVDITDVQLGGVSITSLSNPNSSTITGVTGAHVPGTVDLTVFSSSLGNVTLPDGFAYVPFFGPASDLLTKGAQLDPGIVRTEFFTSETAPLSTNTTLSFILADFPIDVSALELYIRRVGENGGTLQRQGIVYQYSVDLPARQIIWRDTTTFALIATDEIIVRYLAQGTV